QMLSRNLMVRANNRSLKERPDTFLNVAPNPFLDVVVGGVVHRVFVRNPGFLAFFDAESDFATTGQCAQHHSFVVQIATTDMATLSADVGFVKLHCASEVYRASLFHRFADAMAQIPCRLVADRKHPLKLNSRDSFLGLD